MHSPAEQVRIYFDERDRQYEARQSAHRKAEADRIFNDPLTLSLIVSEAIDESPMKWGFALQALRDGDPFQASALATTAVYESLS